MKKKERKKKLLSFDRDFYKKIEKSAKKNGRNETVEIRELIKKGLEL